MSTIDFFNRVPVQAEESRHMADRGDFTQSRDRVGEPTGHARIRIKPPQLLKLRTASSARHPNAWHDQLDTVLKQRQIANPPFLQLVNRPGMPAATAAAARRPPHRIQSD